MADLTITAGEVLASTNDATYYTGTVGSAQITAGQACFLDTSVNTIKLAGATASTTCTTKGIALNTGAAGQPIKLQGGGTITVGAAAGVVNGTVYILSGTAPGGIAPSTDAAAGWYISVIGVGNSAAQLVMVLNNSGVLRTT